MTKCEESLRCEVTVSNLVTKENSSQRRDPKNTSNRCLLPSREFKHLHVGKDLNLPSTPNADLQHHHGEESSLHRPPHTVRLGHIILVGIRGYKCLRIRQDLHDARS